MFQRLQDAKTKLESLSALAGKKCFIFILNIFNPNKDQSFHLSNSWLVFCKCFQWFQNFCFLVKSKPAPLQWFGKCITVHIRHKFSSIALLQYKLCSVNTFPNNKFWTLPNWKSLKMIIWWKWQKVLQMHWKHGNFSFSHNVFKRLVLQTHENQGLFGKGLKESLNCIFVIHYSKLVVDSSTFPKDCQNLEVECGSTVL